MVPIRKSMALSTTRTLCFVLLTLLISVESFSSLHSSQNNLRTIRSISNGHDTKSPSLSLQQARVPFVSVSEVDGHEHADDTTRRSLLRNAPFLPLALMLTTASPSAVSAASSMEKVAKMTEEEAETKLREGYKTINYLLDNYEKICEGGGDNVRRYLGTIVTNPPSPLVGISKAMKTLEDRADDFIEYTEMSDEVVKSINQADGSAYMAIFVTTSTSYTPPKKYFDDALVEVKRCKTALKEVASMVGVTLT